MNVISSPRIPFNACGNFVSLFLIMSHCNCVVLYIHFINLCFFAFSCCGIDFLQCRYHDFFLCLCIIHFIYCFHLFLILFVYVYTYWQSTGCEFPNPERPHICLSSELSLSNSLVYGPESSHEAFKCGCVNTQAQRHRSNRLSSACQLSYSDHMKIFWFQELSVCLLQQTVEFFTTEP